MHERPQPILAVNGPGIPIRGDDIDTDQIIPARFLKEITFVNMGEYAFYDLRRDESGQPNDHPFNLFEGARILIVNQNFGCGSSREHAPQALMRWGIRGIIGESFAEIFAGNCLSLGIPVVTGTADDVASLQERVEQAPSTELEVDVEHKIVRTGDSIYPLKMDAAHREALLNGVWDTTALMVGALDAVREKGKELPYLNDFRLP